jgi:hypothetical protein
MRYGLNLHPNSRSAAALMIDAEATWSRGGGLELAYVVSGALERVRWPAAASATRTDGLWRHTCFEAFVRPSAADAYCEFNFSPSGQWAAYRFNGYRSVQSEAPVAPVPLIRLETEPDRVLLRAMLESDVLSDLPRGSWRLGLSAVIEEIDGRLSYWALTHPPGKPDFHHPDGFAATLPMPEEP